MLHDYAREPFAKHGFLNPQRVLEYGRKLLSEFDVRGGSEQTRASSLSGGNQQKVVVAREVARDPRVLIAAQPTRGLDVGAIEFVHRRLVEERDEGRAVLLVSLELEEVLSLADRILVIYEGTFVGRVPAGRERGGAGHRDDRRQAGGGCGMTEPPELVEQAAPEPDGSPPSVAERLAFYQRAGGIVTPIFTVLLAFLAGGMVVLATGHNPLRTYKAVWDGTGLNWFFEFGNHHIDLPFTNHQIFFWWDTNTNGLAAYNLTQTAILTTSLIFTGLAVAFAFRCGLFNIGGQGQYITGAIISVWVGSSWAGMAQGPHVVLAILLAMLAGAGLAAIAGFLKATVGAHEVISTIMLNWIAILARQLRVRPGRSAADQGRRVGADLGRRHSERQAADVLGQSRSSRRCTSASSSRSPRSSSSG